MSISSIPQFLPWLYDQVSALELPDVQVFLGQPNRQSFANDVLILGWAPDDPAVTSEWDGTGLSTLRSEERYTVRNLVSSTRGRGSTQVVLQRAFAMIDAVAGVLAANPTADGLVMRASIGAFNVENVQTTEGVDCSVMFTVPVLGHTRRF